MKTECAVRMELFSAGIEGMRWLKSEGVEKYLLKDCSTQEAFSFSLCCEECRAIWKSKSIRFSRARVTPLSEGKRVIFDVLYKKEKEEALIRATAEAGMVFNKCPIYSRLVCDELDMCVSCAHYLQEQREPVEPGNERKP